MRVAVFGAGAIGCVIGGKLAQAGHDVTLIARGPHLAALQRHGLRLTSDGRTETVAVRACADVEEAGPQDYVFATTKAHGLAQAAEPVARLLGAEASLVTAINGVPYWYFHGTGGAHEGRVVDSVDPGGVLWRALPPERAIGCVVYPAAEITAPGEVLHSYGDRLPIGEPDGRRRDRSAALAAALTASGFRAPVRPRIRDDIWLKLLGNLSFNPLSVLTGATLARLAGEPGLRAVARAMMTEAQTAAETLGVRFSIDVEKRIDGAGAVGEHRTSMLQDFLAGRPLELDAVLGAVVELGALAGADMPTCRMILALTAERARQRP